jgi:hypothetical protein
MKSWCAVAAHFFSALVSRHLPNMRRSATDRPSMTHHHMILVCRGAFSSFHYIQPLIKSAAWAHVRLEWRGPRGELTARWIFGSIYNCWAAMRRLLHDACWSRSSVRTCYKSSGRERVMMRGWNRRRLRSEGRRLYRREVRKIVGELRVDIGVVRYFLTRSSRKPRSSPSKDEPFSQEMPLKVQFSNRGLKISDSKPGCRSSLSSSLLCEIDTTNRFLTLSSFSRQAFSCFLSQDPRFTPGKRFGVRNRHANCGHRRTTHLHIYGLWWGLMANLWWRVSGITCWNYPSLTRDGSPRLRLLPPGPCLSIIVIECITYQKSVIGHLLECTY